jgi:hypothetical protein
MRLTDHAMLRKDELCKDLYKDDLCKGEHRVDGHTHHTSATKTAEVTVSRHIAVNGLNARHANTNMTGAYH